MIDKLVNIINVFVNNPNTFHFFIFLLYFSTFLIYLIFHFVFLFFSPSKKEKERKVGIYRHPHWLSNFNVQFSLQFNIQKRNSVIGLFEKNDKERSYDIDLGQPISMPIYADLLIAPALPSCPEIKNDFILYCN